MACLLRAIDIRDWENSFEPKLAGTPVRLPPPAPKNTNVPTPEVFSGFEDLTAKGLTALTAVEIPRKR